MNWSDMSHCVKVCEAVDLFNIQILDQWFIDLQKHFRPSWEYSNNI